MRFRLSFFSLVMVMFFMAQPSLAQDKPQLVVQDGHSDTINALFFRATGTEAITASEDGTIKVWDLAEGRVLRTIYNREKYKTHDYKPKIEHSIFFPEKDQILTVSRGQFSSFEVDSGKLLSSFKLEGYNGGLQSDGENLFVVANNVVTKLDLTGKVLKRSAKLDEMNGYERETLSLGGDNLAIMDRKSVLILSPQDLSLKRKFPREMAQRQAISPDGTLLSLSVRKVLKIINVADGTVVASASDEELGCTRDGLSYLQPYWIGETPYWARVANYREDVPSFIAGKDFKPMQLPEPNLGFGMAGNDLGELLISELNGKFHLIRPDGANTMFPGQTAGTTAFKLSLENKLLATGSNTGTVKLWDLKTGKLSRTLDGLTAYVGNIDVSPDGKKIVASDLYRGQVITWDRETGKQLSEVKVEARRFGDGASKLIFLDNNSYLLLRTENGRVSVFNADTGQEEDYRELGKPGMRLAAVHPNGRRVTVVNGKGVMTEFGLDSKRDRLSIEIPGGIDSRGHLTYSHDRKSVLVSSGHGNIYRWQYDDPENKLKKVASPWNRRLASYFIEDANKIIAVSNQGRVTYYYSDGRIENATPLAKNYISRPQNVNDDLFLFNSTGDALVLANLSTGEYLGELVEFEAGKGWAVFTKDGRFDGNDFGLKKLDFELDGTVYRLSQFFNDYYTPGLAASLFATQDAQKPEDTRALTSTTLKKPPRVDVTSPKSGTVLEQADFEVTVSVTERGAGASKVGLYHNGHRLPERNKTKIDDTTYKFKVKAVQGVNDIRATAFDGSGSVEARRDRLRVVAPKIEARKPRLHLLAVGVDEYKSGLSLKYADDDATSVSQLFTSDIYETGERILLTNKDATLDNILSTVTDLAKKAEPQDALVVYLAGHGTVLGETYYFLPHDADVVSDQKLATTALSSDLLAKRLSEVPATKQLLVLDSCRSGAAAGVLGKYVAARSGLEEIRSQQMLARTSGTFLIAATQAEDYAYEIPELGHGVLTYSILNSMGKTGKDNGKVTTANGLLRNVSSLVPELTQKYHGTTQQVVQYSSGQDFPLAR